MRQDAKLAGKFDLGYGIGTIQRNVDGWIKDLYSNMNYNVLPSDFKECTCNCELKLLENNNEKIKKIYTSTGSGFKYHKEVDGFSLLKKWWVLDDNNEQTVFDNILNQIIN